MSLVDNKGRV
jgi:AraC-like DNA-binding protein